MLVVDFIIIGIILLFLILATWPEKKENKPSYEGIDERQEAFMRVCHTLKDANVVVVSEHDGIYVRMADSGDGAFSFEFAKVYSFDKSKREISNYKEIQNDRERSTITGV